MMRSLYSGVSGLQNHQVRMDVIGNNISNVNTYGFKKGRVTFQDMLSQTMSGAARPNDEVGGVNPKQVGLGMSVASIDTIHTQGALQSTGVNTDLAIQGNGFFILKDGDKSFYTRDGSFIVDKDGTFVNPANGRKVQGWMAINVGGEPFIRTAADIEDLIIPIGSKDEPSATSEVDIQCNLNKNTKIIGPDATERERLEGTWTTTFKVYDTFGDEHSLELNFTRVEGTENNNRWVCQVVVDSEKTNTTVDVNSGEGNRVIQDSNSFFVDFDNLGTLQAVRDRDPADTGNQNFLSNDLKDITNTPGGKLSVQIGFDVTGARIPAGQNSVRQNFNLNLGTIGSMIETLTQSAEKSSSKIFRQNGYPMGYLENFRIDQSGVITGVYSNGTNRLLGQVAMASFSNPGGLEKAGENTFVITNNSGNAMIGPSGIAGKGTFMAGALEMSNVDLSEQFVDMIVTQRGFQANSKTIQTSDQMLQEIMTLKR